MGVYNDHANSEEFSIPLVPAGNGASGGGYGDQVFVSLSVAKHNSVHTTLLEGSTVVEEKDWDLPPGRTLVAVAKKLPNGNSPTALNVKPSGADRIDWSVEWERPS